jgi:lipopolysaccharide export system ATP-binding protein
MTKKQSHLETVKPGLHATHIAKSYKKKPVLRDVSIHVKQGESVALLGPNGAGKTSLFYIITGLVESNEGRITLDGQDITPLPMYRRARLGLGYLPQEASIFRGLNVEDNIRAILQTSDMDKSRQESLLDELLAEFSISHLRRTTSSFRNCACAGLTTKIYFIG